MLPYNGIPKLLIVCLLTLRISNIWKGIQNNVVFLKNYENKIHYFRKEMKVTIAIILLLF